MSKYLSLCLLTALWGIVPDVELLDPVVTLCVIFLGTARLFATAAVREGSGFSRSEVGPFLAPGHGGEGAGAGRLRVLTPLTCRPGSEPDGLMVCP